MWYQRQTSAALHKYAYSPPGGSTIEIYRRGEQSGKKTPATCNKCCTLLFDPSRCSGVVLLHIATGRQSAESTGLADCVVVRRAVPWRGRHLPKVPQEMIFSFPSPVDLPTTDRRRLLTQSPLLFTSSSSNNSIQGRRKMHAVVQRAQSSSNLRP